MTVPDPLVEPAVRLFEFLTEAQQIKDRPVLDAANYQQLHWFSDFPAHRAVNVAIFGELESDVVATVDRIPEPTPPPVPLALKGLLDREIDAPRNAPQIDEVAFAGFDEGERERLRRVYENWFDTWSDWAEKEDAEQPARDLYKRLFATRVEAAGNDEQFELVIGLGLLTWRPGGGALIRRHLLTTPATIEFDDRTGRLSIMLAQAFDDARLEHDMVDPMLIADQSRVHEIRAQLGEERSHPIDREHVAAVVRRLVHAFDPGGGYEDCDAPVEPTRHAQGGFAPALLLRRRSRRGLIEIFQTILRQLRASGTVPSGLRPVFDADHDPSFTQPRLDGALVDIDGEGFLPLPVNDVQLEILRWVDTRAQTLVQGPPGTGKTHTAAALLSHLLAQGKRVLVTAQTDRALKEVRDKLPKEIRHLAVAVVGNGREEMAALRVAVERIGDRVTDHVPGEAQRVIERCMGRIDELRQERSGLHRDLVSVREAEVAVHEAHGYRGTLASIAQEHQAQKALHEWIDGLIDPDSAQPLTDDEITEWLGLLLDDELNADEAEATRRLVPIDELATPEQFAALSDAERRLTVAHDRYAALADHPALNSIAALAAHARTPLRERVGRVIGEIEHLRQRREAWIAEALTDVLKGRPKVWAGRYDELRALIDQATPFVKRLGGRTRISVTGDRGPLGALARAMYSHLLGGGKLKTGADGSVQYGLTTPRVVKQARLLFDSVRVNGIAPTSPEQLELFLCWVEADDILDALDRAWPQNVVIPEEDTLSERLQWHQVELDQLNRLLRFATELAQIQQLLHHHGVLPPDWADATALSAWVAVMDSVDLAWQLDAATQPLAALSDAVADRARWADAASETRDLSEAVERRDIERYAHAFARTRRLHAAAGDIARRTELATRLNTSAAALRQAVEEQPGLPEWPARFAAFTDAWNWAAAGRWIRTRQDLDVNRLRRQVDHVDEQIRSQVEHLAATRAWSHAAAPDRVSGRTRRALSLYGQLVRRHGKGTGKYATRQLQDIRTALDDCRSAVPVWIMPIHRIADQLRIESDMFDVVVVDEASQAGLEALFLQYLAPRIVVIGDDRQVSPSAVGFDRPRLEDAARRHLTNAQDRAAWLDPQRSLFDEARMRFQRPLTLREHRRCVPEIIGFSNQIAYEPDGIKLFPVRQYGADRLDPIVPVEVEDGYTLGATSKHNPVEVRAIAEQIEKCFNDPAYDGKTFGVISLLGPTQAKAIERELLKRVAPQEWDARELRCGIAADFQGSERDVMFLSMVAAVDAETRLTALTGDMYIQRFNVAASRAKDQMWVFHSVKLSDLNNPEDLRRRLLDYCYNVKHRIEADGLDERPVPDDLRVEPYDSLFEQRVRNLLHERGYRVEPQVEANGYRIDLVVVGGKGKLAVECDGDHWHGPEAYERDLARQRDLERCGWRFFRISESQFYVDRAASIEELVDRLRELEIHPLGWKPETAAVEIARDKVYVESPPWPSSEPETPRALDDGRVAPVLSLSINPEPETDDPEPATDNLEPETSNPEPPTVQQGTVAKGSRETYREFAGSFPSLDEDASLGTLIEGLRSIVAVEGPILGEYLKRAYRGATGAKRTGRVIADHLERAIQVMVDRGELERSDPLERGSVAAGTYRLPEQSSVRVRTLGPRAINDVPPAELATVMARCADRTGWHDTEVLFRAVLTSYGLKRLTDNTESCLRNVLDLARSIVSR